MATGGAEAASQCLRSRRAEVGPSPGPFPALGLRALLDLPRWLSYRATLNVAPVALGKTHFSSKMEKMPMG